MHIKSKVAIVTGASSGIGAAVATALGQRGARVTLTARRKEKLEAAATAVRKAGGEALVLTADVRSEPELIRAFDDSQAHWGRLDILVNCAGIGRQASLHDGTTEDWRAMLEVNVLGLTIATREALQRFDGEQGGHIVNISSMSGHRSPPKGGFYPATKFAVRGLTDALRLEMRARSSPNRVSCISPGFVTTEFFEGYFHGDREKIEEVLSRYRFLDPEDVAKTVLYVLEAPDHVAVHDVLMRPTEQPT